MIMAAGSTYTAGTTGDSASHTHTTEGHILTVAETPAHTHTRGTMDITGAITCFLRIIKVMKLIGRMHVKELFIKALVIIMKKLVL